MLVRKDLSQEQQAVQACHASIEASRNFLPLGVEHPHLALCSVNSEIQLINAIQKLERLGIRHSVFRETDLGDQITALATETISGDLRRHFKHYRLLTYEQQEVPV